MKKFILLLAVMLLFSGALFAQTTQGASGDQGNYQDNFARGAYEGPVLGIIDIDELKNAEPNEWVILEGYLIQERRPGVYILGKTASTPVLNYGDTVIIHFDPSDWVNLQINANIPVLVHGIVNRYQLNIEIEAVRIEIPR